MTDCLGNIIEVVSHPRKKSECVSGEMSRNGGNLVNEEIAVAFVGMYRCIQSEERRLSHIENKTKDFFYFSSL